MSTIDHAAVHSQLVMIAERLLKCSEQFESCGSALGQLCRSVERLLDAEYGGRHRDGA